jgi:hypothetical protein
MMTLVVSRRGCECKCACGWGESEGEARRAWNRLWGMSSLCDGDSGRCAFDCRSCGRVASLSNWLVMDGNDEENNSSG